MEFEEILFSGHATRRMFERGISTSDVRAVIETGETIADYPDDLPYPSKVMLGVVGGSALHVVVAMDKGSEKCYVVTAYYPEPGDWDIEFRTRRTP